MEERRKQKTIEGFGRIFKPRYTRKSADGSPRVYQNPIWWIAYYHNGEELRESSDSTEEKEAIKLLKRRIQDLGPRHRWHERRESHLRGAGGRSENQLQSEREAQP